MKKFAKILIVALTFCLIVGAIAVSASAAVTPPTGAAGTITDSSNSDLQGWEIANDKKSCVDVGTNHISNGTHEGHASSTTAKCQNGITYTVNIKPFAQESDGKYLTVDFDICSDAYLVDNAADTNAESGQLAYRSNIAIAWNTTAFGWFISDTNGNWYLSYDSSATNGRVTQYKQSYVNVPLATEKNVWNHITMVDDGTNVYLYLDGEFVTSKAMTFKGEASSTVGLYIYPLVISKCTDYSIKVDNFIMHEYSSDYSSGVANGIDDITLGDVNYNLSACVDTYYSQEYFTTFTYEDFDGNVIKTGKYDISTALTSTEKIDLDNGWYDVQVNSWKLKGDTQGDIVLGGEYTLVPDDFEIVSDFSAKFNYSLTTSYIPYFYVRDDATVTDIVVKNGDTEKTDSTLVEIDGKNYMAYQMASAYNTFGLTQKVQPSFEFTVDYKGKTQSLTASISAIYVQGYCAKVVSQYGCGTEQANLALSLLRFANESYKVQAGVEDGHEGANAVLNAHADCACNFSTAAALPAPSVEDGLNASALNAKGYLISYAIAPSVPKLVLTVPTTEAVNIESITATLTGITKDNTYGEVTVGFNKTEGEENYTYASDGTLEIFNIAEIVTINVTYNDGTEAISGTHSLAKYINGLAADDTYLNVSKAIYYFAQAAKEYKLEEKAAQ